MKSVQQQQYLPPFTQRVEVYQQTDFSGSETDVSTSNENLTREEKYVLQNLTRQEPQGEENNCNRSIDQSSCNTLIIHSNIHSDEILDHGSLNRYEIKANNNNNSACISGNMQRNIYSVPVSPHLKRTSHSTMSSVTGYSGNYYLPSLSSPLGRSTYTSNKRMENQEGKEISRQCLDQSEVLKHLTKQSDGRQLEFDFTGLPPPPEYPKVSNAETVQSTQMEKSNKLNVSWSQPELAKMAVTKMEEMSLKEDGCFNQRPKTRGRAAIESDPEAVALKNAELIEYITEENMALKAELEIYYNKVSRLQKFDLEIQKVHISYEDLVKSSDKRERLARAIQMKLEMEIRRLQEINKDLKDQLEVAACQLTKNQPHEVADSELRREMHKRDHLIAQLITQNKELVAAKERQEIELAAQRATLQEQRTHIDILDSALTNAQANVVKLEEECRKKQAYVERVGQLQKALASLQLASDKREQMEKRLRIQLEKEIQELRAQKVGETPTVKNCKEKVDELKRQVREYEEKLMASQAEVSKWEQRYLEESAMRQIAIDAASMPKDAKIAALERTSQESERVIAQAHTDKLRHMDELHASNKRCAELEAKIKDFESKLAEKDAMIKVLQKHSIEKDVAYHNVLLRSPRHTPHPSFHAQLSTIADSTDNNGVEASSSSTVTTTTSSLSITSGSSNTLALPTSSKNSIDQQLKELESHLSKDSIIQALRAEKEKYPSHYWRV